MRPLTSRNKMKDTATPEVKNFLERLGFDVSRIDEVPEAKRADLRVSDSTDSYVIEVKSRQDDGFEETLRVNGVAESMTELTYANSISKQIGNAVEQLETTSRGTDEYKLLWYHDLMEDETNRVVNTLYGIVELIQPAESGAESIDCLYFTFSDFFRYPTLVGAVLGHRNGGLLFLNNKSPILPSFRGSQLYHEFNSRTKVWDPTQLEGSGKVYVADCSEDRRNEKAMIQYVETKYSVSPLIPAKPKHVRVGVVITDKEDT